MKEHKEEGLRAGEGLLQKLAENDAYRKWILIAGFIGMALIFLSGHFKQGDEKMTNGDPEFIQNSSLSADEYTAQMEESLTELISSIHGAGNCKILVTLERNTQYVYATEEKTSTQTTQDQAVSARLQENDSRETKYIIVRDADGAQKALAVTEVQPVVKGVVVVCEGGDQPAVQQDIINAVTTALNLSSARVCVIKAN